MEALCVYCGSSPGTDALYVENARALGQALAARSITLVYGGAHVGVMGAVADATLEAGGAVVGVIPRALMERELAHEGLTEQIVVESMHERKATMADRADGFVAMPGGLGTLEEIFEVLTWAQLGIHSKPCGLLNVAGYYSPLLTFLDRAVTQGFVREEHRGLLLEDDDPERLLTRFEDFQPPARKKWLDRSET